MVIDKSYVIIRTFWVLLGKDESYGGNLLYTVWRRQIAGALGTKSSNMGLTHYSSAQTDRSFSKKSSGCQWMQSAELLKMWRKSRSGLRNTNEYGSNITYTYNI